MLGGRESVGVHEDLIVRARGDLDAGRLAAAAVGLDAGLRAMVARGDATDALREAAELAAESRRAALTGSEPDPGAVAEALRSAEAAMRRRAVD